MNTHTSASDIQKQQLANAQPVHACPLADILGLDDYDMDTLRRRLKLPDCEAPSGRGIRATVFPAELIYEAIQQGYLEGERVAIDAIDLEAKTQTRRKNDKARIARYADAMRGGEKFRPVVLIELASGKRVIADGWHRVLAAIEAGIIEITAVIIRGSEELARAISGAFNSRHGLNYSASEEKNRAVAAIEKHKVALLAGKISCRAIARIEGLTHTAINKYKPLVLGGPTLPAVGNASRSPRNKKECTVRIPPESRQALIEIFKAVHASESIELPAGTRAQIPTLLRLLGVKL